MASSIGEPSSNNLDLGTDSPSQPSFNIPPELTLHIISFLDGLDVFSLGCCSRTLNELCNFDNVWKDVYMKRWPDHYSQILKPEGSEIWKVKYISRHKEIYNTIYSRLRQMHEHLQKSNFLEIDIYNKAIESLRDLKLGLEDISHFFLRKKVHAALNLIGVHYSFLCLEISGEDLRKTISFHGVLDREITVYWAFKAVPDGYDAEWPMEYDFVVMSLNEITNDGKAILDFLQNGCTVNVKYVAIATHFDPPRDLIVNQN